MQGINLGSCINCIHPLSLWERGNRFMSQGGTP